MLHVSLKYGKEVTILLRPPPIGMPLNYAIEPPNGSKAVHPHMQGAIHVGGIDEGYELGSGGGGAHAPTVSPEAGASSPGPLKTKLTEHRPDAELAPNSGVSDAHPHASSVKFLRGIDRAVCEAVKVWQRTWWADLR